MDFWDEDVKPTKNYESDEEDNKPKILKRYTIK